jgi:hypothetical protein
MNKTDMKWKEGHPDIVDNKQTAEKRLLAITKHLFRIEKVEEYDRVFAEWLETGVVEKVSKKEDKNCG